MQRNPSGPTGGGSDRALGSPTWPLQSWPSVPNVSLRRLPETQSATRACDQPSGLLESNSFFMDEAPADQPKRSSRAYSRDQGGQGGSHRCLSRGVRVTVPWTRSISPSLLLDWARVNHSPVSRHLHCPTTCVDTGVTLGDCAHIHGRGQAILPLDMGDSCSDQQP